MKELFTLVLKTLKESDDEKILIKPIRKSFESFLFKLVFPDGDPDLIIERTRIFLKEGDFIKTGTKGHLWWKKDIMEQEVNVHGNVFDITAGHLEYRTTIEEAKLLEKGRYELISRSIKEEKDKQKETVLKRLKG